jgi:hypothetical protein
VDSIAPVRYHVEIRRGLSRVARAFNLSESELRRQILEPWFHGAPVQFGERQWEPAKCELTVLAGPELDSSRLAIGQGWSNAERTAEDVTARLLAAPPLPTAVAVLAQSAEAAQTARAVLARIELRALDWDPRHAAAAPAVIAFDPRAGDGDARWWLNVGVALGALGARALLATLGPGPLPPPLEEAVAIPLDAAEPQALRERLRRASRGD